MITKKWLLISLLGITLCAAACGPSATPSTAPAVTPTTAAAQTTSPAGQPTTPPSQGSIKFPAPFPGEAQALTAAGATSPAVLYTKWFDEYFKLTKVKVNYQAIGSGGGIKGLQDATVDFGATD